MFNRETMINVVRKLGFKFAGRLPFSGGRYQFNGHTLEIFAYGVYHIKPDGSRVAYPPEARAAEICAAICNSLG